MNTKEKIYKCNNTIIELSKMLSDRFWSDDSIEDRFVLAALTDGIHSAATELQDLADYLPDPDENDSESPELTSTPLRSFESEKIMNTEQNLNESRDGGSELNDGLDQEPDLNTVCTPGYTWRDKKTSCKMEAQSYFDNDVPITENPYFENTWPWKWFYDEYQRLCV